ncbi:hypothetical protein FBUS_00841 [Fasciolopsis buskii]|uniref:Uncharacterized protein n=1 Tax=Fasciolopsis buskii TaxID=27845 RepID=A0A8E0RM73_9TREM|nr:hypothetical protein FBUS_00841 [Fasciolopsis buski]
MVLPNGPYADPCLPLRTSHPSRITSFHWNNPYDPLCKLQTGQCTSSSPAFNNRLYSTPPVTQHERQTSHEHQTDGCYVTGENTTFDLGQQSAEEDKNEKPVTAASSDPLSRVPTPGRSCRAMNKSSPASNGDEQNDTTAPGFTTLETVSSRSSPFRFTFDETEPNQTGFVAFARPTSYTNSFKNGPAAYEDRPCDTRHYPTRLSADPLDLASTDAPRDPSTVYRFGSFPIGTNKQRRSYPYEQVDTNCSNQFISPFLEVPRGGICQAGNPGEQYCSILIHCASINEAFCY